MAQITLNRIQPTGRRVLLERIKKDHVDKIGMIIIPPNYEQAELQRQTYIEMRVKRLGTAPEFDVKVGDVVLVHRLHGFPCGDKFKNEAEHEKIVMENELLAIIERRAS